MISFLSCSAGFSLTLSDYSSETFCTTDIGMSMRQFKVLAAFFLLLGGCSEDPASQRIDSWRKSLKFDVPDFDETRTAAEGGNADAQIIWGKDAEGIGVTQDAAGCEVVSRGSGTGVSRVAVQLGGMYDRGEGVVQDQVEAALWYQRAARQGHVDAVWRIGVMNEDGIGVTQDLVEAYAWFDFGCKIGHKGFLPRLRATEAALGKKPNGKLGEAKNRAADYLNRYGARMW